jgi:hypothetical protein
MINAQEAKALVDQFDIDKAEKDRKELDSAMKVLNEAITSAAKKGKEQVVVLYATNPKSTITDLKSNKVWLGECIMTNSVAAGYNGTIPHCTEIAERLKQELEILGYTVELELSKIDISW